MRIHISNNNHHPHYLEEENVQPPAPQTPITTTPTSGSTSSLQPPPSMKMLDCSDLELNEDHHHYQGTTYFPETPQYAKAVSSLALSSGAHHHAPTINEDAKRRRGGTRRGSLNAEAKNVLKRWMFSPEHFAHPYPSEEEKEELAAEAGIEVKQLSNWFTNARKRLWQPVLRQSGVEVKNFLSTGRGGPRGTRLDIPVNINLMTDHVSITKSNENNSHHQHRLDHRKCSTSHYCENSYYTSQKSHNRLMMMTEEDEEEEEDDGEDAPEQHHYHRQSHPFPHPEHARQYSAPDLNNLTTHPNLSHLSSGKRALLMKFKSNALSTTTGSVTGQSAKRPKLTQHISQLDEQEIRAAESLLGLLHAY